MKIVKNLNLKKKLPSTLSVIIPTKNRPDLLRRALRSVAVQEYQSFEICVVDNNNDHKKQTEIEKIVKELAYEYPSLKWLYVHSTKPFASGVRNDGIAATSGDIIIFLDDDDEMLENSISIRMKVMLAQPELVLLYCGGYSKIYPYPFKMYRYYHYNKRMHHDRLLMMSCSSMMINRKIFESNNLHFDEGQSRMDDYDLCKMIIKLNLNVKSIPDPLVMIYLHPDTRISSQELIDYSFKEKLIERWGSQEKDVVFAYAQGVYQWRKCFGNNNQSLKEISRDLYKGFERYPTLSFRLKFMLISISPYLFLALYHVSVFLTQSYKNMLARIKTY
ncbi:MAG: glycosyltransferase family 2 protein [Bacteroidetes bacterium]|jgi:glycosyltransferase involved in cell wall biosynthesis|nr:glycosyltransferase family 2 protein [Bacteroidota bacterium]